MTSKFSAQIFCPNFLPKYSAQIFCPNIRPKFSAQVLLLCCVCCSSCSRIVKNLNPFLTPAFIAPTIPFILLFYMVFDTVLLLYYTVHFCVYFLGRKFAAVKFSAQKVFFLRKVLPKDFLPKSLILLQFICPLHDFLPNMRFSAQMFDSLSICLPIT